MTLTPTEALPSRWAALWDSSPGGKRTALFRRWIDDTTIMTFERYGSSAEWVLLDRPRDYTAGVPLPALVYCPTGVAGCRLGDAREEVVRDWKGRHSNPDDPEPLILVPETVGRYDTIYVWSSRGKITRILARNATPNDARLEAGQMAKALEATMGLVTRPAGSWMHQEAPERVVRLIGWHDARTRVRLFWQEDKGIPRVFTEWTPAP